MKNFSMEVKAPTTVVFTAPDLAGAPLKMTTKSTVLKTTPSQKAQTVQIQKPGATFATPTQIRNPFLTYPGKPFYQRRTAREYEEAIYLTYPSQSPLQSPTQVSKASLLQGAYAGQLSKMGQDLKFDSGQIQAFVQAQDVGQAQASVTTQVQELTTTQQTTQVTKQDLKRNWNLDLGFDFGGGGRRRPAIFGGVGRFKRVYPIVTGEDFLKNILGSTTKKKRGRKK
jgi:hypothetical protein